MIRFLFLIVVFSITSSAHAQFRTPETDMLANTVALMENHPDPQLRQDMTSWYRAGRFRITIDPSGVGDMGLTYACEAPARVKCWPVLRVSPLFFTTTFQETDDLLTFRMEKFGYFYHEYVHLRNHFSGKYPLNSPANSSTTATEASAQYHWGTEWEAFRGQWEFLRRMKYEFVFFNSPKAKLGEPAFLEKFYSNLQKYPHFPVLKPFFERYYKEQKNKPTADSSKDPRLLFV